MDRSLSTPWPPSQQQRRLSLQRSYPRTSFLQLLPGLLVHLLLPVAIVQIVLDLLQSKYQLEEDYARVSLVQLLPNLSKALAACAAYSLSLDAFQSALLMSAGALFTCFGCAALSRPLRPAHRSSARIPSSGIRLSYAISSGSRGCPWHTTFRASDDFLPNLLSGRTAFVGGNWIAPRCRPFWSGLSSHNRNIPLASRYLSEVSHGTNAMVGAA
jgi:hypothetical protein